MTPLFEVGRLLLPIGMLLLTLELLEWSIGACVRPISSVAVRRAVHLVACWVGAVVWVYVAYVVVIFES